MSRKAATAVATRGNAISEGMADLAGRRVKARAKRDGVPAKQLIFTAWLAALSAGKAFDAAALAKKYPDVKQNSIRVWASWWLRHNGVGSGYPANARGKEREIRAAIKKALAA